MKFKAPVGISNHHLHLTDEIYQNLFSMEETIVTPISQKGEYATNHYVSIEGPKGEISHVRVMGPNRSYNQVELSASDAFILGINPPICLSGQLTDACDVYVKYQDKKIFLSKSCIIPQTHLHISPELAEKYNLHHDQQICVKIKTVRPGFLIAKVKVKENGVLDFHIDRDQANAFLLHNNDEVEVAL